MVNGAREYETATAAELVNTHFTSLKFSKAKPSLPPLYSGLQVAYSLYSCTVKLFIKTTFHRPFCNYFLGVKFMAKVLSQEPSRSQISLFGVDWFRFMKSNAGLRKTLRLSLITAGMSISDSRTNTADTLLQRIQMERDPEAKGELVLEYTCMVMSDLTGQSFSSEMDLNKNLYSQGVDSTVALTLKLLLESNLQVTIEVSSLRNERKSI